MNRKWYSEAAEVLRKLEKKKGSLKSLVFNQPHASSTSTTGERKKVYALVAQTLKYKRLILEVMDNCEILKKEPKLSLHLCMVLLYDMLFGKGIQCGGPVKRAMHRHKAEILKCLEGAKEGLRPLSQEVILPSFARVNLLKSTVDDAIEALIQTGFVLEEWDQVIDLYKVCVTSKDPAEPATCDHKHFAKDLHVPDVLVFCSSVNLLDHTLFTSGRIFLQDKASCLPAYLLSPPPGSHVIDACAAPGNKTSQLASIMRDQGCIYAFDKNQQRFSSLETMVAKSGASCVKPLLHDFLLTNPSDYTSVNYILVDPSCSGSGIVGRVNFDSEVTTDTSRLRRLSVFQGKILKHALGFPSVQRVVYSTCSIHKEENEYVVESALKEFHSSFQLQHILPQWEQRGLPVFEGAHHCIRANPENHFSCGFFIAVFQRKNPSSTVHLSEATDDSCETVTEKTSSKGVSFRVKPRRTKTGKKRRRKYQPVTK